MNKFLLLPILALGMSAAKAQTPVWSTDVAPILFNKCASCHRPTGIAPFSLLTYNDAKSEAGSIASAVQTRNMPPWPPDPAYNALAHERLLTQNEIDKIKNWVTGGTPQGDPNLAPPQPQFNANGDIPGTPDLSIQIPTYTSTASTGDVYQCFVIPSNQAAEKYITAFEAIPGNREIVHHVLVYADTSGVCAGLDAASPGPGYTSFGGVGSNDAKLIGGWVPGTAPIQMPNGFGIRLPKNADIVVQIHYPAGSNGQKDDTKINFFFSSSAVRSVSIDPVLNHFTNISPALNIPANQVKNFTEKQPIPFNASVLGVAPHMHLIGRNISVFGVPLASTDTQKYIRINNWNFQWQGFYMFKKIKKVSAGTTLYSIAFYDNTSGNPFNPSNPPQNVTAGEATTDEMMLTYFIWTQYQAGDENIIIDSTVGLQVPEVLYGKQELFAPYPNPVTNELVIKYYLANNEMCSLDIIDMNGRVVKQMAGNGIKAAGYHIDKHSVADLTNGIYTLRLHSADKILTQKLVVRK
jgi:hypothetical protein